MMRRVPGLFIATILVALSVVAALGDARANGMPYNQFPGGAAGVVTPLSHQGVEVVGEELTIDFISRKEYMVFNPHLEARVEARYTMNNRTGSGLEIPVAFPHPGPTGGWVVTLDGREVPLDEDKGVEERSIGAENNSPEWRDPFSGESYIPVNSRGRTMADPSRVPAKTFMLALDPGEHNLTVAYRAGAGVDELRSLNPVYRFRYLIRPAAAWGSFKDLEVTVRVPFSHRLLSSLPLERLDRHTWRGRFADLPGDDLTIFFASTSGTWGGLVNSREAAMLVLALSVVLLWILRRFRLPRLDRRTALSLNLALTLLVAWIGYVTLNRKIFPYPLNALQYPLSWSMAAWLFIPWLKDLGLIRFISNFLVRINPK